MKYFVSLMLLPLLFACKSGRGDQALSNRERDSLMMVSVEKDRQMNKLVGALLDIDDNLQQIKEKEQLITLNVSRDEAGSEAVEDKINRDIQAIYELMVQNKETISQLERQLKQASTNSSNLNKLVKRLNTQLKDKTLEIIELQARLKEQRLTIDDLNFSLEGLQLVVDSLEGARHATQQALDETTEKLYRAYYAFGSKKELKEENIISSDGFLSKNKLLSDGFSQDYFTAIDYRELDSLNLFMPKAKILSNHPESSYTLEESEGGAMVLTIRDKEQFWRLTRHLVIQVNK
ncbi:MULTISPECIES: hypothetical protein [unclassified Carboxylicivirga]|uniref:Cbp1 family collagen-binding glycoprotein adhesin n=1 Tax=Carboxylicivirga TaxID=1628153 RepID=UPI003D32BE6F